MNKIWINLNAVKAFNSNANKDYPNETGGLLWGYQYPKEGLNVITDIIGPGPKAKHSRNSFRPDYDYHIQELSKIYKKDRRLSYIGDWHSHPNGGCYLSFRDKKTLKNIANYPSSKLPNPVMLILYGEPENWEFTAYQLFKRKTWWREKNIFAPLKIKNYSKTGW